MDIDPEALGEEIKPESETVKDLKKDTTGVEKRLQEIELEFEKVKSLNLDLMLSDMYQLTKDVEDANKLLNSVGTIEQFSNLSELERRRGTELAYVACKGYLQDASRDRSIAQISLVAIKDLLNKLQEKLIIYDEKGMMRETSETDDSDILEAS